jgi:peptidoglycan/LPS O-acetylase OafA/YrhL
LSFSVPRNFGAICSHAIGDDTVSCFHGIKTLSMLWIILGHTCMIGLLYSDNKELQKYAEQQFIFQTVINSVYSVDTFFFVSGFLVSFLYLRNNAKGNLKKLSEGHNNFTSQALHLIGLTSYRIIRLAIPYLYMIAATLFMMRYYASNSVFEMPTLDHINCAQHWWRNVFYINTFFPVKDMCMIWSWYLANDTQFFMLGAFFLIIGVKHFKFSVFCLSLFMVSAWITTGDQTQQLTVPLTHQPLFVFSLHRLHDRYRRSV